MADVLHFSATHEKYCFVGAKSQAGKTDLFLILISIQDGMGHEKVQLFFLKTTLLVKNVKKNVVALSWFNMKGKRG